jgi:uncharacterized protein YndB with AHSA1/START domain
MTRIREEVVIAVPRTEVWRAVHVDLEDMPRWAGYLKRAEYVGAGRPGPGTRIRYELNLPSSLSMMLEVTDWEPPTHCAGLFVEGPVRGSWSYRYREVDEGTLAVLETDYELTGLLRFAGGLMKGQYEAGLRQALSNLRAYLEAGPASQG